MVKTSPSALSRFMGTMQPGASNKTSIDAKHFLQLSQDILCVIAQDGAIRYSNGRLESLLGYDTKDLKTRQFYDLIFGEDRDAFRAALTDNPQMPYTCDARMVTKIGAIHWARWRFTIEDECIYAVGQDITDMKQQQDALARHEQQLSEAQKIGRMGYWHWDVGAESLEWSPQIYRIFGVDEDFQPTLDNINDFVGRRDKARMMQAFQRAILARRDYDMDFEIQTPTGKTRYIHCVGRCEMDNEGQVCALFGIMQDVTERAAYEQELRAAKDTAERAFAARTQFLANMSHELRTPLNAIIGFSDMMGKQMLGPIENNKYLEYIKGIHESGEHLLDLINDILDMSRMEAGHYDLTIEDVNVYKVMQLAIHMVETRASQSGVKLSVKMPDDTLTIEVDRRALLQIVLNVLSNAVKFTKGGGTVRLECWQRDEYLAIKIIDTGIGIPPNKLASVTKPFEQVECDYTRTHEGSGLGLAITQELVSLHNGTMHIDSELDKGTTVTVRLPYRQTV